MILKYLPEKLREVFFADTTTNRLKQIGDKYKLSKQARSILGEAVGLVLLGVMSRKEFQDHLYENLPEEKDTISKIVKDTRSIFQPVSAKLEQLDAEKLLHEAEMKANNAGTNEASNEMPVPPPPPGGDTPTPSYGGTSDPYREPAEE